MSPLAQSSQEIVMRELAELSEAQREEVLSFIHSLKGKQSLTPQDSRAVSFTRSAHTQQARQKAQSAEPITLIALKRFSEEKQQRLNFLTEKNTEGTITKEEFSELEELVGEAQALMLQNTETLARLIRSDLFDKKGHPIKRLTALAVRAKASHKDVYKESPS